MKIKKKLLAVTVAGSSTVLAAYVIHVRRNQNDSKVKTRTPNTKRLSNVQKSPSNKKRTEKLEYSRSARLGSKSRTIGTTRAVRCVLVTRRNN